MYKEPCQDEYFKKKKTTVRTDASAASIWNQFSSEAYKLCSMQATTGMRQEEVLHTCLEFEGKKHRRREEKLNFSPAAKKRQ